METSLRYGGDSKALRIHAKQKVLLKSHHQTHLQLQGELDTRVGGATFLSALVRHHFPQFQSSFGVGLDYSKRRDKLGCVFRAKKSFPVTNNDHLSFTIKASSRCDFDHNYNLNYKRSTSQASAHLSWTLLNFQQDQDVRFKLGYNLLHHLPFFQVRDNNWTFNAHANGKWNLRFDL